MEIKEENKYIIAVVTEEFLFLRSLYHGRYLFTDDIAMATKFTSKATAKEYINYYHTDTNDTIDLVVIPLRIKYDLVNETKEI